MSMAMLVLVAALALTARQPPPPSVAEFAPSSEQIKNAPAAQSSQFGQGDNGADGGGGAATTLPPTTTTTAKDGRGNTIDVARVRKCVGDPPRQIEDPQSPPCVNYWEGDNGGATAKGVTDNEIRIAIPNGGNDDDLAFATFFNRRFEFYGRQIKVYKLQYDNNAEGRHAAAVRADDELHAFASLDNDGRLEFTKELTSRKIISVAYEQALPERVRAQMAPYNWAYPLDNDGIFANMGQWVCRRLAGQKATHAGTRDATPMVTEPRKFGLFLFTYEQVPADAAALKRELDACGVELAVESGCSGDCIFDTAPHQSAMLKFKQAGVTSVICLCQVIGLQQLFQAGTGQQYFPEWLVSTYTQLDDNFSIKSLAGRPEHLNHLFGITVRPRQVSSANDPASWALREVNPGLAAQQDSVAAYGRHKAYRSLLLLASGIQLAGPHLTAESFQRGLQKALFPNPVTPINAGEVRFGTGHSMTSDAAEMWWSTSARGPYSDDGGTYCYVDGGQRHRLGNWPFGGDPFFHLPCDSGG
jgi:hypothetical protein